MYKNKTFKMTTNSSTFSELFLMPIEINFKNILWIFKVLMFFF